LSVKNVQVEKMRRKLMNTIIRTLAAVRAAAKRKIHECFVSFKNGEGLK
jgi:outer membrane lipopolysaccharide assembly protein LptE/RlpB